MNLKDIKVVWSRRSLLKEGETTDINGFSPYQFSFTDGTRLQRNVRRCDLVNASVYQKKLFESKAYIFNIEIWHTKDEKEVYLFCTPSNEVKELLPD